jgi:cytochrome P450
MTESTVKPQATHAGASCPTDQTFGAGPHRFMGAHLARHELVVAYEERHERIPNHWTDPEVLISETAGEVFSLNNLPLRWDMPGAGRRP